MLTWLSIMLAGRLYAGPAFTRRWFMYHVYITGWPPIGAIIHVGLQLGKHILMLVHCLQGLPNFNPSMPLVFWCVKNTCHLHQCSPVISPGISLTRPLHQCSPVISPGILLTSFIQSHALAPASQESGGPSFGQH